MPPAMGMWPILALWECHMKLKWGGVQQKEKIKEKQFGGRERQVIVVLTGV